MKTQGKIRPVRFIICNDVDCAKWPRHAVFLIGLHGELSVTSPVFSCEMAQHGLEELARAGTLAATEIPSLSRMIRESGLPLIITRADRIVGSFEDRETQQYYIETIFGLVPPDPGSGPVRFERCYLSCNFACCQLLPPHGHYYLQGRAKPLWGHFSEEAALLSLDHAVQSGLIEERLRDEFSIQIRSAGLAEKAGREDRLMAIIPSGSEQVLEIVLGMRPPEVGAAEARFELCEEHTPDKPRHGAIYLHGLRCAATQALFSARAASEVLVRLAVLGWVSIAEAQTIASQIEQAHLPVEHKLDSLSIAVLHICQ